MLPLDIRPYDDNRRLVLKGCFFFSQSSFHRIFGIIATKSGYIFKKIRWDSCQLPKTRPAYQKNPAGFAKQSAKNPARFKKKSQNQARIPKNFAQNLAELSKIHSESGQIS